MPYDASPYTKEELEALRHPPTRCVNLSDDERWLATLDAVTSERDVAVALLKEARCDVEGFATWTDDPDSSYYSSLDECRAPAVARLAKIDAFLSRTAAPKPESKVEKARREFAEAVGREELALHDVRAARGKEQIKEQCRKWTDASDAALRCKNALLAAERDAARDNV